MSTHTGPPDNVTLGLFPSADGTRIAVGRFETKTFPASVEGREAAECWLSERGLTPCGDVIEAAMEAC